MQNGQQWQTTFVSKVQNLYFDQTSQKFVPKSLLNNQSSTGSAVWYKTKFGSQNLATNFGNQL